jgi:hypothetical protein
MSKVLQKKIQPYENYLIDNGYDGSELEIILRDRKDSHIKLGNLEKIILPSEYTSFVPFGNPPALMFGYGFDNDNKFVSVFIAPNEAVYLKMKGANEKKSTHPILMFDQIEEGMLKVLREAKTESNTEKFKMNDNNGKVNCECIEGLKGLDGLIFNLIAGRKTVVLGETDQIIKLLQILIFLIPEDYQDKYGMTINIPVIKNDNTIILTGLVNTDGIVFAERVDQFLSEGFDIVDLYSNSVYGEFSSQYSQDIAKLLVQHNLTDAQQIITNIFDMAATISKEDSAAVIADKLKVRFDDSDLIKAVNTQFMNR